MIIDVDMGNTRLKWRSTHEGVVHACDDWRKALGGWSLLASRGGQEAVHRVRVSSVVKRELEVEFAAAVEGALGVEAEFARVKDSVGGLRLAYKDQSLLGVDRWLSMLAARSVDPFSSWFVVNAGTALTVDLVANDGSHIGGYIVPGVRMSVMGLAEKTGKIGHVSDNVEKNWQPGGSTLECVQSGLSAMYQGFISVVWKQACEKMEEPCVVWSGGNALALSKLVCLQSQELVHPALALDGLAIALP